MRTRAMTAFSATMLGGLLLLTPIGGASAEGAAEGNPDPSIEQLAPSPLSLILADADGADPLTVLKIKVGETRRIVLILRNDGTSALTVLNVTDVNASCTTLKLVEQSCRPHDEILSSNAKLVLGVDQSVTCSFTVEGVSNGEGLLRMTAFGIADSRKPADKPSGPQAPASTTTPTSSTTAPPPQSVPR